MKKSNFILSRYFLFSLIVHLSVITLVLYLIYEVETEVAVPGIEIGLIDSPSGNKKDSEIEKDRSRKVTKKETSVPKNSISAARSKETVQPLTDEIKAEKKLHEKELSEMKTKENFSSPLPDSSSYKSGITSKNSGLILAHPDYRYNPKPKYPIIAKRRGYEGTVLLNVYVLESGKVGELNLEKASGFPVLDESAINSVKNWIFVPGKRNGISVSSWVQVPIKFQLTNI